MIIQLPKTLIDQIAAGEVVVRPASVVKELVENSIDAQARHVTVTIGNALRDIAVADDGIGMSRDDAQLALQRHATSKIRSVEDLHAIRTRGFRGEALPSMAAVSRMILTTRRPEDLAATRIAVEGGAVGRIDSVGAPPGTTVAVRELFYNTPARLKFLKSAATEVGQAMRVVVRQALAMPSLAFRFVNQQRGLLDLPAEQSLQTRAQQILGVAAEDLLAVQFDKYGIRISGYIAKPLEARRDRRHQFFFVNGRPISHRTLNYSLQQAYEGLLTTQRYPVVAIFVELAPDEVDVNVHPTKEEVRFREENKITGLVHRAVSEALHAANLMPQLSVPSQPPTTPDKTAPPVAPDYLEQFRQASQAIQPPAAPYEAPPAGHTERKGPEPADIPPVSIPPPVDETARQEVGRAETGPCSSAFAPAPEDQRSPSVEASTFPERSRPKPLGQIADTYIVAEVGEDLLLIDQHAAHERILYLRAKQAHGRSTTQPLLIPIPVEVRPSNRPYMEELVPVLGELGFETEPFGGQTFVIRSVPAMFDQVDVPAFIDDLLDDLAGEGAAREGERLRERILTRLACHAAIKAGQHLQPAEMQRLVDDLLAAELAYTCPHGRPTMIRLTHEQLDRQFKRR